MANFVSSPFCHLALAPVSKFAHNWQMKVDILRALRGKLGLSQESLSADIGISVSQISRVERGLRRLRLDEAVRWATRLGIGVADIPPGNLQDDLTSKCSEKGKNAYDLRLIEETLRAAAALGPRKWEEDEFILAAELIQEFLLRRQSSGEDIEIHRMKLELHIRRALQRESQ